MVNESCMKESDDITHNKKDEVGALGFVIKTVTVKHTTQDCTSSILAPQTSSLNSQVTGQFLPGRVTKLEILKHFKRVTC